VYFVALDDTDNIDTQGTGQLARALAGTLAAEYRVVGVTRHQLLVHPDVPYTKNNSANVVALDEDDIELDSLADRVTEFVRPKCADGSDPGLCIAAASQVDGLTFGRTCQTEVVDVERALALAAQHNVYLRSLGGEPCGIIGAFAGACLAASGNDGRFVQIGRARELTGTVSVDVIIEAGVSDVRTEDGESVRKGVVETGDKLRPALRDGKAVLFVKPCSEDRWEALKL
jgi:hypothetical protein